MSEIYLNEVQIAMIKKAIADGKKCLIISDLMINIFGAEIEVTNAHTGDVMKVVNPDINNGEFHYKLKSKKRSVKGTSDYLDYDLAMRIANDILWHGRQPQVGFYVIFSINTGLRVGDTLKLKHADMIGKQAGDYLIITEQKTGKRRQVQLNDKVIDAYKYLQKRNRTKPTDYVFKSQKNHVFATVTINRTLKRIFKGCAPVISSHSLRKTFGRRVYEMNGRSEHSLVLLSDIFGHSNLAITRRYLGLRKEEISNVYLNL
jgi:integrase